MMVMSREDSRARLPRFQPSSATWVLCVLSQVT